MLRHLDLFSGIGGFALGLQWAGGYETIGFCEIDKFCQKVLRKHWPDVPIYEDIDNLICKLNAQIVKQEKSPEESHIANPATQGVSTLGTQKTERGKGSEITNTTRKENLKLLNTMAESVPVVENAGLSSLPSITKTIMETQSAENTNHRHGNLSLSEDTQTITRFFATTAITQSQITEHAHTRNINIITAGFPCQPASVAGRRLGTKDDRWLWPKLIEVIRLVKPEWIILENVRGLITLEDGMVFENCLSELEAAGYETESIVIPACAVGAPHRRDRVWIVAHAAGEQDNRVRRNCGRKRCDMGRQEQAVRSKDRQTNYNSLGRQGEDVADTKRKGLERADAARHTCSGGRPAELGQGRRQGNWWATEPDVGRVAHGIPSRVDRLKSLGNAIVPQIAQIIGMAIMERDKNDQA